MTPVCAVFIATSLDGYIARPDGRLDWLSRFEASGQDYGYEAFFESVDALVVGRNTYEVVRGLERWPYGTKRCVVLTHRPATATATEEFASGTPEVILERLASAGAKRVYVDGGDVIRQFLAAGLIDELTLSIVPVLLGSGIRLFAAGLAERWLTLESSRSWPSGLTQLRYTLARGGASARG